MIYLVGSRILMELLDNRVYDEFGWMPNWMYRDQPYTILLAEVQEGI